MITTSKLSQLPQSQVDAMKVLFKECFAESWEESVPFQDDIVLLAHKDDSVLGFCFIHNTLPNGEEGHWFYNLCVGSAYRGEGIATELMKAATTYKNLQCHVVIGDVEEMYVKNGWVPLDTWRVKYRLYKWVGSEVSVSPPKTSVKVSSQYCVTENLFYLD